MLRQGPGHFTKNGYGLPVDIWSFGILVYVLFTAEDPWDEGTIMGDIFHVDLRTRPDLEHRAPVDVIQMMFRATRKEASERPSISELVRHMHGVPHLGADSEHIHSQSVHSRGTSTRNDDKRAAAKPPRFW